MNTTKYEGLDPDVARGLDALVATVTRTMREQRRCCLTCAYWDHVRDGCTLAAGAVPPPRIVAYGCNSYRRDDVPF